MCTLLDRIADHARLSEAERADIAIGMLNDPGLKAALSESADLVSCLVDKLGDLAATASDGDQRKVTVDMLTLRPAINANSNRQWMAMNQYLEKEARRLGLSLGEESAD